MNKLLPGRRLEELIWRYPINYTDNTDRDFYHMMNKRINMVIKRYSRQTRYYVEIDWSQASVCSRVTGCHMVMGSGIEDSGTSHNSSARHSCPYITGK